MPGRYSTEIRNARLVVVRDALHGGRIEILSDAGVRLAVIDLDKVSGDVMSGSLLFSGFPKFAMAESTGLPYVARLVSATGAVVREGMTVGVHIPATATAPAKSFDIAIENANIQIGNVVKLERAEIRHA